MAIKSRHKTSPEFSMASMSDLVFLLLIFFMLTSNFVQQAGIKIARRIPTEIAPHEESLDYLRTKKARTGHQLEFLFGDSSS